jgi:hypothetical protein
MEDSVLASRLNMLKKSLEAAGGSEENSCYACGFENVCKHADWKENLLPSLQHSLGKVARSNIEAIRNLRENGISSKEAWEKYRKIHEDSRDLFDECLELIGGLAIRDKGLGGRICEMADELIQSCAINSTGREWNSITVPAKEEALKDTLARIIRLRFPEWTVWSLPLTAHEFGHVITSESLDLIAFIKDQTNSKVEDYMARQGLYSEYGMSKDWATRRIESHICEFIADAFATYTMGPAYAYAAILIRLNPWTYQGDRSSPSDEERVQLVLSVLGDLMQKGILSLQGDKIEGMIETEGALAPLVSNSYKRLLSIHRISQWEDLNPSDVERAYLILAILERMDKDETRQHYDDDINYLRIKWDDAMTLANPSDRLTDQEKRDLDLLADSLFRKISISLNPAARYRITSKANKDEGWLVAQKWSDEWNKSLKNDPPDDLMIPEVSRDCMLRDVLNAAWICRRYHFDKTNDIEYAAIRLYDAIVSKRSEPHHIGALDTDARPKPSRV